MGCSQHVLDFIIFYDALFRRIHQEKASRFQAPFIGDLFLGYRNRAGFRTQHHPVVLRHIVAGRAQAIPVQHAADHRAVAEADGCGTVPGFHHKGLVAVKILLILGHGRILLPGFRNHGNHGMRQGMPCHHEILQAVIKHGGITAGLIDYREHLFHIREKRRLGLAFPGVQPVDITPDRIDFPVMHNIAVGMGPGPAGEGIGAEAGMDQRHGCRKIKVGQVQIKMPQLQGGKHSLIHNRPGRQAGNIKVRSHHLTLGNDFLFRHLADNVQLALKIHLAFHIRRLADKHLDDAGTDGLGRFPDDALVNGDLAPA